MTVLGGANGAAEAYLRGYWTTPDLTGVLQVMARNLAAASRLGRFATQLLLPFTSLARWSQRNTVLGSKRNIAAHYDLSNDFFGLMLDPTMTYSCGVFPHASTTLQEASLEKYDRICRNLQLRPDDRLLEIGTGWGGFAEYVAREYGCHVTTTTISDAQHEYAHDRFRNEGISDRITLLHRDYRELAGQYDKLVSIEMVEAVGERFLPQFFAKCSKLLKPDGMMALQAITMPDYRYASYRRSIDFIQQYIFPGGFLPSLGKMAACIGGDTDLRIAQSEDFTADYARTLSAWRDNFEANLGLVRELGFDDRFVRMWSYYLSYCEAGFLERQVAVGQYLLRKPMAK